MALIHPDILASVFVVTSEGAEHGSMVQGSGFLIARPDDMPYSAWQGEEASQGRNWHFYAVTCRHVIDGIVGKTQTRPVVHLNRTGKLKTLQFVTEDRDWHRSQTEDIAVFKMTQVVMAKLPDFQISLWPWKPNNQLLREEMQNENVWAGHPVFVLGFPEGRGWDREEGHVPLVRQGIIAHVSRYLEGRENTFLVDGNSYGGNSGGPVLTQPTIMSVGRTHAHGSTSLIGMMCESSQGQRQEGWWDGKELHRLQETSGLGVVVGIETVHRTIDKKIVLDNAEPNRNEVQ